MTYTLTIHWKGAPNTQVKTSDLKEFQIIRDIYESHSMVEKVEVEK